MSSCRLKTADVDDDSLRLKPFLRLPGYESLAAGSKTQSVESLRQVDRCRARFAVFGGFLMTTKQLIGIWPGTCGGAPIILGTRLTCGVVVSKLMVSESVADFRKTYHFVSVAAITECLEYCGSLNCTKDLPVNYCPGCQLERGDEDPPAAFAALSCLRDVFGSTFGDA